MGQANERADFLVEQRSIEFIPHELRHGKPSDLMFVWFGANMELPVVAAGATTVASGLSLGWAVVGILTGVLLGTLLMASHSAQGPHLGMPQMIQSRAQFGYYGAAVPLIFVVLMYLGFYAAGVVLGAQALYELAKVPVTAGIVVLSLASTVVAVFGYNLIHRFERYLSYLVAAVFLVLTVLLVTRHHPGEITPVSTGFALGPFLLAVSVPAISQLGFAPYVADYARYLPASTSISSVFWYTYAGVGVSGAWLMILGAALQQRFLGGPVAAIGTVAHGAGGTFAAITFVALILGVLSINALNIYGGYMSTMTLATTFYRRWRGGLAVRLAFILPVAAVATYLGFLYRDNLLGSFETFLVIVMALMSPWTAVNLVDYYVVRRGEYEVDAMYRPDGVYGRVNPAGMAAYLIGFAVQLPFMHNAYVHGPVARALDGGDVSWVVGAVVSGVLYHRLARVRRPAKLAGQPGSVSSR